MTKHERAENAHFIIAQKDGGAPTQMRMPASISQALGINKWIPRLGDGLNAKIVNRNSPISYKLEIMGV